MLSVFVWNYDKTKKQKQKQNGPDLVITRTENHTNIGIELRSKPNNVNNEKRVFNHLGKVDQLTLFIELIIPVKTTKENALSNYSVVQRDGSKGHWYELIVQWGLH